MCRGADSKCALKGLGLVTAAGCTAALHALVALSKQVALQNAALTDLILCLAEVLNCVALASVHSTAIGAPLHTDE